MNFLELQDEVKDLLNFDSTQSHQDFSEAQIKSAINRAYKREVRKGKQNGLEVWFLDDTTFTWTASSTTHTLADPYDKATLIELTDITDVTPGLKLLFTDDFRWKDRNTLEWLPSGPSAAKTIRATFHELPKVLSADSDVPVIVFQEFHELITYSAAIELRLRADEDAPASWKMHLEDCRMDWWKQLSKGRPHAEGPTIQSPQTQTENVVGF